MPRILVVEDEPLIAMLVEDWLAELAHEMVGPAATAQGALALIETGPIDAAILDVSLDGHDSFAVAAVLRERAIPFAFASGHAGDRIEDRFKGVPTLTKPYDFERVKNLLATLLGGRARSSPAA
jgi:DNA-binding response OmpR family regulator